MKTYNPKTRFTGSGCQAASYVANWRHISKNKKNNKRRRIDDCLRDVSFK